MMVGCYGENQFGALRIDMALKPSVEVTSAAVIVMLLARKIVAIFKYEYNW